MAARAACGSPPPRESALGSLLEAITDPSRAEHFQPTNINFALLPPLTEAELAAMGMAASSWAAEPTVLRVSVSTAWNLPIAQVEDDRLDEVTQSGRYLDATREVLRKHNGLWFYDESYVISRRRD